MAKQDIPERIEDVSADLPYELQSRSFDQLAAVSLAGAGLTVTLIGSVLQDAPPVIWLSVVFFGLAAVTAGSGNRVLITSLFERKPALRKVNLYGQIAIMLVGMAIGSLGVSVYSFTRTAEPPPAAVSQGR